LRLAQLFFQVTAPGDVHQHRQFGRFPAEFNGVPGHFYLD